MTKNEGLTNCKITVTTVLVIMHYWSVTTRTLNKMQIHTIASTKTSRLDLDLNIACLRMPERTLLEAKVLSRVKDGSILLCGEWRRRHGGTGWTEEDLTHLYIFRQSPTNERVVGPARCPPQIPIVSHMASVTLEIGSLAQIGQIPVGLPTWGYLFLPGPTW